MLLVLTCQALHLIFQDCLVPKVGFYELMSLLFDFVVGDEDTQPVYFCSFRFQSVTKSFRNLGPGYVECECG